jgi:hypothetical protein
MELSGQLHVPAALITGKDQQELNGQARGRASEPGRYAEETLDTATANDVNKSKQLSILEVAGSYTGQNTDNTAVFINPSAKILGQCSQRGTCPDSINVHHNFHLTRCSLSY